MAMGVEQIYTDSILPIKYLYKKADNYASDKLVLIFSALGAKPTYNYVRTLEGIDINQLFILDEYGGRGCYYLGQAPDYFVEKSVAALIEMILKENNIEHDNVICAGSSKGGTAALYFATKYKLKNVVVAEPQIEIGKYLIDYKAHDVLGYMIGENYTQKDLNQLNQMLYTLMCKSEILPRMTIHAGRNSYYYKEHISEFLKLMERNSKALIELDLKDYRDHRELIKYYPDLLIDKILCYFPEIKGQLYIRNVLVSKDENKFSLKVEGNGFEEIAWYVYLDGKKVFTKWYSTEPCFEFVAKESGRYSFKAFAQNDQNMKIVKGTQYFEVNKAEIDGD